MAQCYHTLSVCRARLARLDVDGSPLPGAGNQYVTDSIVSVTIQVDLKEGAEYEQENGCGDLCFSFNNRDQIKGLNLQSSWCQHDPELVELMSGGSLIEEGGDNIGYAAPLVGTIPNPDGVSLEVWTLNIQGSAIDSTYPYVRWVFARTYWTPADRTFEAGPIIHPFTGHADENQNWAAGPEGDWPYISNRLWQYAGDPGPIPESMCGAQLTPASP